MISFVSGVYNLTWPIYEMVFLGVNVINFTNFIKGNNLKVVWG